MNTRPPRHPPSSPRRNAQASSPSTKRRADSIDEDYYAQERPWVASNFHPTRGGSLL